ncbi:hypothetical protein HYX07_05000 [Candidatus Woesearchaeota archaeon]|nr:hypothetical protein [Candidatus Woesearchaeota archaeon]
MEHQDIQQIAIVYGKKDLVEYFVEQFNLDRLHDGEEIKAILVKDDLKKDLKHFIHKGD